MVGQARMFAPLPLDGRNRIAQLIRNGALQQFWQIFGAKEVGAIRAVAHKAAVAIQQIKAQLVVR